MPFKQQDNLDDSSSSFFQGGTDNSHFLAKLNFSAEAKKDYYIRVNCFFYGEWGLVKGAAKFKIQVRKA